jgi:hypothetical protein
VTGSLPWDMNVIKKNNRKKGEGSYGKVYYGFDARINQQVALKFISLDKTTRNVVIEEVSKQVYLK